MNLTEYVPRFVRFGLGDKLIEIKRNRRGSSIPLNHLRTSEIPYRCIGGIVARINKYGIIDVGPVCKGLGEGDSKSIDDKDKLDHSSSADPKIRVQSSKQVLMSEPERSVKQSICLQRRREENHRWKGIESA